MPIYVELEKQLGGKAKLTILFADGTRRTGFVEEVGRDLVFGAEWEALWSIWKELPHGDKVTLTI